MDVPGRQPGPADHLPGEDPLSGPHTRIDVPVAEMTEVDVTANPGRGRFLDYASLDRIDPVGAPWRSSLLGSIVANADVDPGVVRRLASRPERSRSGIEERRADRVLPMYRRDGPAEVVVVVALGSCQFSGRIRRHCGTMASKPRPRGHHDKNRRRRQRHSASHAQAGRLDLGELELAGLVVLILPLRRRDRRAKVDEPDEPDREERRSRSKTELS